MKYSLSSNRISSPPTTPLLLRKFKTRSLRLLSSVSKSHHATALTTMLQDRQELGWRQRHESQTTLQWSELQIHCLLRSDVRIFDTLRRVSATGAKASWKADLRYIEAAFAVAFMLKGLCRARTASAPVRQEATDLIEHAICRGPTPCG